MNVGDKVVFEPYPTETGTITRIEGDRVWVKYKDTLTKKESTIPINAAYLKVIER